MKTVSLYGAKAAGRMALVDDEDYALISRYRWHVFEVPRDGRTLGPYARTKPAKSPGFFMHTLITGWSRVDHADCDGLNNQRYNLRPATVLQNNVNQRPYSNAASQYKGVFRIRGGRRRHWYATIRPNGCRVYLGSFADEETAARAYDAAALAEWGKYAYLNFPQEVDMHEGPMK